MSLRETLDDAADLALDGRRVDPVAVLAKAARDDAPAARLRRRAPWLLGVAAAAVVLAIVAAVLPWSALRPVAPAAPPPLGPTGLPSRLDLPPAWAPLVTEQPVEAASMLFPGQVVHGSSTGLGLFVLSADGRHYRRLPWTADQGSTLRALSADGRWVAWTDLPYGTEGPVVTVHVLRLRDGVRRDVTLPGVDLGAQLDGLVFLPRAEGLLVSGQLKQSGGDLTGTTWRIDLRGGAPQVRLLCGCTADPSLAADGTVYVSAAGPGFSDLPVRDLPASPSLLSPDGTPTVVSPDGTAWAAGVGDAVLQIGRQGQDVESLEQPARSNPQVLGWGSRGVLVKWQVATGDGLPRAVRLVWFDPQRRTVTVAAELPAWTVSLRPVVAAGLVRAGTTVPTAPPEDVPWWSGDHRRYLAVRVGVYAFGLLGVGGILGFPWILRRLRRRDGAVLTDANGVAGNQGRLW